MARRRSKRDDTPSSTISQKRDEARQRVNNHLQELESTNTTRKQALAEKTKKNREALWDASVTFFRDIAGVDHEQVWLDLCQDDRRAEAMCKAFLEHYLLDSENRRLVFGPQESETALTITCAVTMEEAWKSLVAEVDHRILSNKRSEEPQNKHQWILKNPQQEKDPLGIFPSSRVRIIGNWAHLQDTSIDSKLTSYDTTQWILNDLAIKYGLSFEQTFVKRAATADDLLKILDAVWTRAADIPCSPQTRYSFDWAVALLGLCGARPCEIMDMTYDNVELAMVRNPTDPTKAVPVATILLQHRKQKTNTVKERKTIITGRVRFKVTIVPCRNVCLTRKIIGQALKDDAFEARYTSYDELVRSSNLEDVDYIPLRWRSDFSGKVMFPIKYSTFLTIWKGAQRVLGMRELLKPYAARVGAGINMDGVFAPAVRNYMLGNSSLVYEKSYVPQAVSGKDLMKAAWNALAGTDETTPQLRHATHSRDENAPVWPTQQDLEAIESRQDIQKLRAEYEAMSKKHGRNSTEARNTKRRLDSDVSALRKLAVSRQREQYFANADQLRSLGKSAAPLRSVAIPERPSSRYSRSVSDALRIGQLMRKDGLHDDDFENEYFESIIAFLQNRHISTKAGTGEEASTERDRAPCSTCLLCELPCAHRSSLTRHTGRAHVSTFDRQFECPECLRQGLTPVVIINRLHWSNHAEKQHGKLNAPNYVSTVPRDAGPLRCPICNNLLSQYRMMRRHVRELHEEQGLFDKPFSCPECLRLDGRNISIDNLESWWNHAKLYHDSTAIAESVLDEASCLMCGKKCASGSVANKHFIAQHVRKEGIFLRPFDCWACSQTESGQVHARIHSQGDCYCHVAIHHTYGAQPEHNGEQRQNFDETAIFVHKMSDLACGSNKKRARSGLEETYSDTAHTRPTKRMAVRSSLDTGEIAVSSHQEIHDGLMIDPQLYE